MLKSLIISEITLHCDWSFFMCNQCCETFILVHSVTSCSLKGNSEQVRTNDYIYPVAI